MKATRLASWFDPQRELLRLTRLLVLPAIASMIAVVACSGKASPHSAAATTTDPGGTKSLTVLWAQWADCMRAHGANIPDPKVNDTGGVNIQGSGDQLALARGEAACRSLQAKAEAAEPNHGQPNRPAMVRYARCMRAHGVNVPDPNANGSIVESGSTPFESTPAFRSASRACDRLMRGG